MRVKKPKKFTPNIDTNISTFFFLSFFISSSSLIFGLVNAMFTRNTNWSSDTFWTVWPVYSNTRSLFARETCYGGSNTIGSGNSPEFIIIRSKYSIRSKILLKSPSWQESKRSKVSCTKACANFAAMFAAKYDGRKRRKSAGVKVHHSLPHKGFSCLHQWLLNRGRVVVLALKCNYITLKVMRSIMGQLCILPKYTPPFGNENHHRGI